MHYSMIVMEVLMFPWLQAGGGEGEMESPLETPGSTFVGVAASFEGRGNGEEDHTHQQMLVSISEEMGVAPGITPDDRMVMDVSVGSTGEGMAGILPQGVTTPTSGTPVTPDGQGGVVGGDGMDRYTCPTCNKVFDRPYRLQRHLQIHNPNRPKVNCQLCDKTFTRMDTLENHMKCLHSNDRPYKCTFEGCPKRFPLQSALMHHLKVCVHVCVCVRMHVRCSPAYAYQGVCMCVYMYVHVYVLAQAHQDVCMCAPCGMYVCVCMERMDTPD